MGAAPPPPMPVAAPPRAPPVAMPPPMAMAAPPPRAPAVAKTSVRRDLERQDDLAGINSDALWTYYYQAAQEKSLDIYTVAAVLNTRFSIARAIFVLILQFFTVPLIVLERANILKGWCEMSYMDEAEGAWRHGAWNGRIAATLFSVYLNFLFWRFYSEVDSRDLLPMRVFDNHLKAKFASTWYVAGMYINTILLFITSFGGLFVMYHTDNAVDVILNALAVGFVVDLDNAICTKADHRDVVRKLRQLSPPERGLERLPIFWSQLQFFVILPQLCITAFSLFVAPFYIAVCY